MPLFLVVESMPSKVIMFFVYYVTQWNFTIVLSWKLCCVLMRITDSEVVWLANAWDEHIYTWELVGEYVVQRGSNVESWYAAGWKHQRIFIMLQS